MLVIAAFDAVYATSSGDCRFVECADTLTIRAHSARSAAAERGADAADRAERPDVEGRDPLRRRRGPRTSPLPAGGPAAFTSVLTRPQRSIDRRERGVDRRRVGEVGRDGEWVRTTGARNDAAPRRAGPGAAAHRDVRAVGGEALRRGRPIPFVPPQSRPLRRSIRGPWRSNVAGTTGRCSAPRRTPDTPTEATRSNQHDVKVECRQRRAAHRHLPPGRCRRSPTLLSTPYGRTGVASVRVRTAAPGYRYVLQRVRGTTARRVRTATSPRRPTAAPPPTRSPTAVVRRPARKLRASYIGFTRSALASTRRRTCRRWRQALSTS